MDVMKKAANDKRLIDADVLVENIEEWLDRVGTALIGNGLSYTGELMGCIEDAPTVDAIPVVRCRECKHSTLPSELTQRYGKPGTLTCHNMHAPINRRNVGSNDFCSYGERKEGAD